MSLLLSSLGFRIRPSMPLNEQNGRGPPSSCIQPRMTGEIHSAVWLGETTLPKQNEKTHSPCHDEAVWNQVSIMLTTKTQTTDGFYSACQGPRWNISDKTTYEIWVDLFSCGNSWLSACVPCAGGDTIRRPTLAEPALLPNNVTLVESPPKYAMLSLIHFKEWIWSENP